MGEIAADVRLGLRRLAKNPGFAAVVVLTLALGIGANTVVFSGVHFALLETIKATEPGELVWIGTTQEDGRVGLAQSFDLYEQLRAVGRPFQGVCAFARRPTAVRAGETTERIDVELATPEFFPLLGVTAALGRVFGEADRDAAVAVLENGYWRDRLAADPDVIGRTIQVTGQPYTIIGVAPAGFHGLQKGSGPALWVPMERTAAVLSGFDAWRSPGWIWLNVFARLPRGADRAEADAAAELALSRHVENQISGWTQADPKAIADAQARHARLQPAAYGEPEKRERAAKTLELLGATVGLILLLACANVANLMLGRASARRQEIAMQLALGAGRLRVSRQLLVESLLLAAAGGAAGELLAWIASPWVGSQLGLVEELPLSLPVLAFTAAISLACGILFGVAPAWTASAVSLASWLKGGTLGARERSWGSRGLLVAAQAALCLPVLVAAGLLLQTLRNLYSVSTGLAVEQVAQGAVDPRANGYDLARSMNVLEELRQRLATRPEVRSAALGDSAAFSGSTSGQGLFTADSEKPLGEDGVNYGIVSDEYFATLGIPILAGRGFAATDTKEAPKVVVVNQALARLVSGDESPLGRKLRGSPFRPADMTIVGVVADNVHDDLRRQIEPFLYRPITQASIGRATVYVRATSSPEAALRLLPTELAAVDPNLPMTQVRTMAESVDQSVRAERRLAGLLSAFGLIGLAIAAVGLYGVLSYAVARRTREVGLRKALGAQAGEIAGMIVRRGLAWVGAGALLGAGLAWTARGLIAATLFGLEPTDWRAYCGAGAVLLVVAGLAAFLPARRAAGIEPMEALRYE